METSKKGDKVKRIDIKVPEYAKIYPFCHGDNNIINSPVWKQLDAILAQAQQNIDNLTEKIFNEFVARLSVYYPDKIIKFKKLWPLIYRQIIKGQRLPDNYYDELKEL